MKTKAFTTHKDFKPEIELHDLEIYFYLQDIYLKGNIDRTYNREFTIIMKEYASRN